MNWLLIFGLGAAWLGWQIVWVAPLPRQLRRKSAGAAEKRTGRTPEDEDRAAFRRFWLDQYAWLGLTLLALGLAAALAGALTEAQR